jgi:hypothetical protein
MNEFDVSWKFMIASCFYSPNNLHKCFIQRSYQPRISWCWLLGGGGRFWDCQQFYQKNYTETLRLILTFLFFYERSSIRFQYLKTNCVSFPFAVLCNVRKAAEDFISNQSVKSYTIKCYIYKYWCPLAKLAFQNCLLNGQPFRHLSHVTWWRVIAQYLCVISQLQ